MKYLIRIGLLVWMCAATAQQLCAQYYQTRESRTEVDKISLGLGIGFDYGGFGASVLAYPQNNLGLFVGGGYAIAGFGYNVGAKVRLTSNARFHPYATAMYGYNTAIAVTNASQLNKIFMARLSGLALTSVHVLGLISRPPVRGSDVDDYMNRLKGMGIGFSNSLPPIGLSLGYRFVLE